MKTFVIVFVLTFASLSQAQTLSCTWQDQVTYAQGFYRPARFDMTLEQEAVVISNDTFFSRRYEPCWIGSFASCYFSFGIDTNKKLDITSQFTTELDLEQTDYFTAWLNLTFEKSFTDLKTGSTVQLTISGDDGDGVIINNDRFICVKK